MGKIVYLTLNILIVYYKLYTLKEIKEKVQNFNMNIVRI